MEFADFVDSFSRILEECLEKFCEEYVLDYDYDYTVEDDNLVTFEAVLWYDHELWEESYKMYIDFTLENKEKCIVIEGRGRDKAIRITIDKTSEKVDWLKNAIIRAMEKLLEKDFEELDKRLEFYYEIKDLIDEYPLDGAWDAIYIEIGRSEVVIHTEYRDGNVYPGKIDIQFEKKEESIAFADFAEKSISIDKTKIEVNPIGIVSINLESLEPEKRFDVLEKVIKALEMLYLF